MLCELQTVYTLQNLTAFEYSTNFEANSIVKFCSFILFVSIDTHYFFLIIDFNFIIASSYGRNGSDFFQLQIFWYMSLTFYFKKQPSNLIEKYLNIYFIKD